jgi:mannose/fructose-specific phosphotransferase system component IIA
LDKKIDAATQDIAVQQKKLESTDELVKALFQKGTTEYFRTNVNAENIVIVTDRPGGSGFNAAQVRADSPDGGNEMEGCFSTSEFISSPKQPAHFLLG